ncbi:hypothetical protein, variant 2 [Aphanomyces invadans]|uniref:RNA-binding S4 domain-containing protein n=1 Tax=Aphanomyces invadans TaxID=157072 RepID=A0A024TTB8_9STRA|nr:hypothetical protein, variant 2 [Aphanomyces invadans]ETV97283.1 hypothetical protein, variant 2 [Aphanomyces invadans]|eukprot:XP_008873989.1 hypothetical protein, variant 2 [Aphanomyces invadans]
MLARVLRRCISIKSSRLTPEEIVAKTKRPLKPTSALSLPLSKTTKGRKGPAAVHMKASVDDLVDTTSAPMRLAKRMAMAGISSRREAEKIILDGRVVVNGSRVTQVAHNVTFDDVVTVDNKTLPARPSKRRVWIAHKLPGELVTSSDPRGRPTIMQRLKAMGFDTHVMAVVCCSLRMMATMPGSSNTPSTQSNECIACSCGDRSCLQSWTNFDVARWLTASSTARWR